MASRIRGVLGTKDFQVDADHVNHEVLVNQEFGTTAKLDHLGARLTGPANCSMQSAGVLDRTGWGHLRWGHQEIQFA